MFSRRRCGHGRRPICCPPNVLPTQYAPAQVSPTQQVVRTNIMNTVVPHIHPTNIHTINRHITHNQHYFPVTQTSEDQYFENNRNCGTPENPNPNCFPLRRGFGF
nr:CotD family spore coat protein [Lysinibacillus timonensis]